MATRIEPAPQAHKSPTDSNRIASAPYNFIPLPEMVVTAVDKPDDLPHHNTYADKKYKHTGYFDVTLTTRSPLYVRAALTLEQFCKQERGDEPKDDFRALAKNTPDFFYTREKQVPVIPGSSLRGMLRALLEIVSYGKMTRVSDKKLFYRTVDDTAVGVHYREQMVEDLGETKVGPNPRAPYYATRVKGGFFRVLDDGTFKIEECTVARADMLDIANAFGKTTVHGLYELNGKPLDPNKGVNPNVTPRWDVQHADVWLEMGAEQAEFFKKKTIPVRRRDGTMGTRLIHHDLYLRMSKGKNLSTTPDPNKVKGTVVLTGWMENKHWAFVFGSKTGKTVDVWNENETDDWNRRLVDRFQDDDQISQWQEKAFPQDNPKGSERAQKGYLCDGEPVFYLEENGHAVFFGRAQLFRLPYKNSPRDLLPEEFRDPFLIDFAEAVFGFVRDDKELKKIKAAGIKAEQGDKARAYASRVFVTDATLTDITLSKDKLWLVKPKDDPLTPPILATPKPTAFQQYLVQLTDIKRRLTHYDSPTYDENDKLISEQTTIRGHKLYWHQGKRTADDLKEKDEQWRRDGKVKPESTQHTQFRPVRDGVQFKFRVHFENLSEEELGALSWTLQPVGEEGKTYCHSLGMGKPFGMGAVQLDATLYLTKRQERYSTLFAGTHWATGQVWDEKKGEPKGELLHESQVLEKYTAPFEQFILEQWQPDRALQHVRDLPRIALLLKLMEFPGFPAQDVLEGKPANQQNRMLADRPNKRYMRIQIPGVKKDGNEYKERPVLPDVTAFMSEQEKKTAQSIAYRQGVELTATVDDEKEGYVYLMLPNQDVEKRYGIIDPEYRRGRVFTRGETIAVKILGLDEDDSAMVVCAPR